MTAYTPVLVAEMSQNYGSTTGGVTVAVITPNSGGDSFQLIGDTLYLRIATAGTASVITADSVDLSNFGQDQNVTITLGTTAVQYAAFDANVSRWKQQTGNVGYLNLTYTSVTTLTIEAFYSST
jgi:hypothetical protein